MGRTICPYCDIEVSESSIEAEDGCCPECGAALTVNSLWEGDDEDEELEDESFDEEFDEDAFFEDEDFEEEIDDDDDDRY